MFEFFGVTNGFAIVYKFAYFSKNVLVLEVTMCCFGQMCKCIEEWHFLGSKGVIFGKFVYMAQNTADFGFKGPGGRQKTIRIFEPNFGNDF